MTPQQRYDMDLQKGLINLDTSQSLAVQRLDELLENLTASGELASSSLRHRISRWWFKSNTADEVRGIYFWGGVGRGKTYLMDVFYDCVPGNNKLRTHFHKFMQGVHQELDSLKGQADPLVKIADKLADRARIICFDEFFVSDIGDAMILARLLERLIKRNVVLLITSNIPPHDLYKNGLQRDRFKPAIKLLENKLLVLELDGSIDYRLRNLSQAKLFHWPLGESTDALLLDNFKGLSPDINEAVEGETIEILGRNIHSRFSSDDVIWFDFGQLCDGPRSVYDYIEIAKLYHAILIGNVPQFDGRRDDQLRRFINLIDELYNRNVKLIIAAEVPLSELYTGLNLDLEFKRTLSRLVEMQSHDYLSKPHRP